MSRHCYEPTLNSTNCNRRAEHYWISGYIVSKRFRRLESFDRQMMIDDALRDPSARLKPEEVRRVVLIVGLTPEEYRVSDLRGSVVSGREDCHA